MVSLISVYIGGVLTIVMAFLHTGFYRMFNWKSDFDKIPVVSARIFYTIHVALFLLFFIIGLISIVYANELSQSKGLAHGFNILLTLFWIWRVIWQFTYFKREKTKKLPFIAILVSTLFVLLSISYLIPVVYRFVQ